MIATLPLATSSVSMGNPEGGHKIEVIMEAIAKNGISGIEICHEHLVELALRLDRRTDDQAILNAAVYVRRACDSLGLEVIALQPFALYEGLVDREQHQKMIARMRHWVVLAHSLNTETIQMPSNFAREGTTGDIDKIVADLKEVAQLTGRASPPIRIAYEAVAWGNYVDLWEQSWDVVKRVNEPNFGLCLDTFHIAGRIYGDPTAASGRATGADEAYQASLDLMKQDLDASKIFYLQLSDAERLSSPLIAGHEWYNIGDNPRMTWSRAARLFPCEEQYGGYLPVLRATEVIINDVGYRGWVSMEIFSRRLAQPDSPDVPFEYAARAKASYQKVIEALNSGALPGGNNAQQD